VTQRSTRTQPGQALLISAVQYATNACKHAYTCWQNVWSLCTVHHHNLVPEPQALIPVCQVSVTTSILERCKGLIHSLHGHCTAQYTACSTGHSTCHNSVSGKVQLCNLMYYKKTNLRSSRTHYTLNREAVMLPGESFMPTA